MTRRILIVGCGFPQLSLIRRARAHGLDPLDQGLGHQGLALHAADRRRSALEADAINLFPTTFDPATQSPRAVYLDHMSARQWIASLMHPQHLALLDWRDPSPFLASLRKQLPGKTAPRAG